ncbi:MAG: hypothetical protein ABIO79_06285 [Ferruginibacter sp.]
MEKYISQLLADIAYATKNVSLPFMEKGLDLQDWISDEEEDKTAPVRNLQDWTGITQESLPPATMLNDEQTQQLLGALIKMLDAYNWSFVLQTQVPEHIQYATIRDNFDQQAKLKRLHMGFFQLCKAGTEHGKCALGEYCQCTFYANYFSGFVDDELSTQEQRARELEIEINHIKRKYGEAWMKYYPYHLDINYDDENGNPYNYDFNNEDENEDNWWRK